MWYSKLGEQKRSSLFVVIKIKHDSDLQDFSPHDFSIYNLCAVGKIMFGFCAWCLI